MLNDGSQIGIIPTTKAREMASNQELDLVEVSPNSNPPVVKILDYSKFRYESEVKHRLTKRHQSNSQLKEVRFRLKVDANDFATKINAAIKFLKAGDKVKTQVMFRGRENQHPEQGVELLQKVASQLEEFGTVISEPTHEGRNVIMLMQPLGRKVQTVSEQHRRGLEAKEKRRARQAARLAAKGLDASGNKISDDKANKKKANDKKGEEDAKE